MVQPRIVRFITIIAQSSRSRIKRDIHSDRQAGKPCSASIVTNCNVEKTFPALGHLAERGAAYVDLTISQGTPPSPLRSDALIGAQLISRSVICACDFAHIENRIENCIDTWRMISRRYSAARFSACNKSGSYEVRATFAARESGASSQRASAKPEHGGSCLRAKRTRGRDCAAGLRRRCAARQRRRAAFAGERRLRV